jgi:hypothetical protein
VVSSKAKRLGRTKKGLVFNFPAKKAITVTGVQWTGALLTGQEGGVKVVLMSWWTTRGAYATTPRIQEEELLKQCLRQWGNQFLHIFDRAKFEMTHKSCPVSSVYPEQIEFRSSPFDGVKTRQNPESTNYW